MRARVAGVVIAAICSALPAAAFDSERVARQNESAVVVTFASNQPGDSNSQGSGICVAPDGLILCTAHQVEKFAHIRVRLLDGSEYPARIEVLDSDADFALLRIDAAFSRTAAIGDATRLRRGSPLLAITSPKGLEFSAVQGIVSNADLVRNGRAVIQTDLPASPGSSGGPVFDERGALIGIVAGRVNEVEGAVLLNPINNAYALLQRFGIPTENAGGGSAADLEIIPAANLTAAEYKGIDAYNAGVRAASVLDKIAHYTAALEILPELFEAWFNLGVAQTDSGNTDAAAEAYRRALALAPNSLAAHRNLGRVYLARKSYADAIKTFIGAVELNPMDPSVHNDLGEAYRRAGDSEQAEAAFRAALERQSSYAPAQYNLALTLAQAGRREEAVTEFRRYLELAPDAADAEEVRDWIRRLSAGSE